MEKSIQVNLKSLAYDFTFIAAGYVCLYFYSIYNNYDKFSHMSAVIMPVAVAATIITIWMFPADMKEKKGIYASKKALIPFLIVYAIFLATIFTSNKFFRLNNSTLGNLDRKLYLLITLGLSLTVFISYFFKIRLKEFSWRISLKSFVMVIVAYGIYQLVWRCIGAIHIGNVFNMKFITRFIEGAIVQSIYPGFYEEVMFRGFLISALKGFGSSDEKCNVIQAVIFGITHVMSWGTASWVFLLATAGQAMLGYVLGKIYFKTESLVPCILFHGLLDAMHI